MIVGFKHRGLKKFYENDDGSRLNPQHLERIRIILSVLDVAKSIEDIDLITFSLHELSGDRKGVWSITVRANWRITFVFEDGHASAVNYEDYH